MCRVITPASGYTSFWLDLAASDLTGPAPSDWSKAGTTSPPACVLAVPPDQTLNCSISKNSTERGYIFTPSGVPGTNGQTGDYDLVLRILTGDTNIKASFQVHRINSSGTVQASSSTTAEQTANAGVLVFSLASVNLGTWNSGDRIRADVILRNAKTSGGAITITLHLGRREPVSDAHRMSIADQVTILSSQVS